MQPTYQQRIIRLLIIGVVLLALGWAFYYFVMLGKVAVSAPQNATLRVTAVGSGAVQEFSNTSAATARVTPGEYLVQAQNGANQSFTYVTASWFKTTSTSLDTPPSALSASSVANVSAQAPMIQNGKLVYVSNEDDRAHALDDSGKNIILTSTDDNAGQIVSTTNGSTYRPQPIADNTFIANNGSQLIAVRDGVVKPLSTEGIDDYIAPLYAIIGANPNQASFTITIGGTVYFYSSVDATPQRIVETKKRVSHAAYGGDRAILYSTDMPYAKENITEAYTGNSYAINPVIVNVKDKSTREIAGPITDATISPDGALATLRYRNRSTMDIIRLESGEVLRTIQAPAAASPFWINDTEFVFEQGGILRQYSAESGKGHALGDVGAIATSITKNGDTYLVGTLNATTSPVINKVVRLQTQPINNQVEKAAGTLPLTSEDGWTVSYSNINQPTLHITTVFSIIGDDYQAYISNTLAGRQKALDALRAKEINPSDFTLRYNPTDAEMTQL